MTSCYKTSNNKYFKCPPRMSDGRHFTDYRLNCGVNNLIENNQQITSSYQYRQHLTHNATKLMDLNRNNNRNCIHSVPSLLPPPSYGLSLCLFPLRNGNTNSEMANVFFHGPLFLSPSGGEPSV